MRTLRIGINGFGASVSLPDEYFDERGIPRWNLLNARFSSPNITWSRPLGGVPHDEDVVYQPKELPPIGEELQKLRDVVASLQKKFYG